MWCFLDINCVQRRWNRAFRVELRVCPPATGWKKGEYAQYVSLLSRCKSHNVTEVKYLWNSTVSRPLAMQDDLGSASSVCVSCSLDLSSWHTHWLHHRCESRRSAAWRETERVSPHMIKQPQTVALRQSRYMPQRSTQSDKQPCGILRQLWPWGRRRHGQHADQHSGRVVLGRELQQQEKTRLSKPLFWLVWLESVWSSDKNWKWLQKVSTFHFGKALPLQSDFKKGVSVATLKHATHYSLLQAL